MIRTGGLDAPSVLYLAQQRVGLCYAILISIHAIADGILTRMGEGVAAG